MVASDVPLNNGVAIRCWCTKTKVTLSGFCALLAGDGAFLLSLPAEDGPHTPIARQ